jgi:protein gp37
MGHKTGIEWCDHTYNPWMDCTKVSPACDHCYAEAQEDARYGRVEWGGPRRRTSEATRRTPYRWDREAAAADERRRVFCMSLVPLHRGFDGLSQSSSQRHDADHLVRRA